MNGEEKKFFQEEFIALKATLNERWKNHEERSSEFKSVIKETFNSLCISIKDVMKKVNSLPCDVHDERYQSIEDDLKSIKNNELKHLNGKINALLFTVLASVFVGILVIAIRIVLMKLNISSV